MANTLFLVAGVVIGLIAGWLIRGSRNGTAQAADTPVTSTSSSTAATEPSGLVDSPADTTTAPITEPATASAGPIAETVAQPDIEPAEPAGEPATITAAGETEPATITEPTEIDLIEETVVIDPVTETVVIDQVTETVVIEPTAEPASPIAESAPIAETEPIADTAGTAPITEPARTEPIAETVVIEPVAAAAEAEPVGTGVGVADIAVVETTPDATAAPVDEPVVPLPGVAEADEVAPIAVAVQEPDDLTKIPGIGPKMAMALAAGGITTFRKLADSDLPTLRAAVTGAGMRLAPSLPTWPEQAKLRIDTAG